MKKNNDIFKKVIVIALVAVVLIYLTRKFWIKPAPGAVTAASTGGGAAPLPSSGLKKVGSDTTLKRGMIAQEIEWLQYLYNIKVADVRGVPRLDQDGVFGAKTEAAVQEQSQNKTTTWNRWSKLLNSGNTSSGSAWSTTGSTGSW